MSVAELSEAIETATLPPDPWPNPQPLPAGMPAVEAFDYQLLPDELRGRALDIAERLQCPPDYAAVGLMVAAGSVLGRQVEIRPKRHDDWGVTSNLWGAIVGRPALSKSPAHRRPRAKSSSWRSLPRKNTKRPAKAARW